MEDNLLKKEARKAAEVIKKGGVILYPTDTIWGIGCDATNKEAVEKIFQIKKRDKNKSLIVLIKEYSDLHDYINNLPVITYDLLKSVKQPMTVIYQYAKNLAGNLISADGTIAVRIPKDEFCLELIKEAGVPIVSTSANFSGEASAICFNKISKDLIPQMDYVVKYGQDVIKNVKPSRIIKLMEDGNFIVIRE